VVLTLFSHLIVTLGFPLPVPNAAIAKDASRLFPCQNRPCGCLTADECWKGDCCCFTLEQKLAWAEANGREPPAHVRPLVEARKASLSQAEKKYPEYFSENDQEEESPSDSTIPSCCRQGKHLPVNCCPHAVECCEKVQNDCHACAAKASPECSKKKLSRKEPDIRWPVGLFDQKCRGQGPAGLFQLEPAVFPTLTSNWLAAPLVVATLTDREERLSSTSHFPPTPPPRST